MGRKDKTKQQKDDEKPAAEKNAGNAKGGKTEQAGKEEKQQKGGKKVKKNININTVGDDQSHPDFLFFLEHVLR
ncbi:hypothetical protein PC123_g2907 [Phytophthora cactorum]|nr:hypothetical protein PC123_g2907 [Phytophthora cactorum]